MTDISWRNDGYRSITSVDFNVTFAFSSFAFYTCSLSRFRTFAFYNFPPLLTEVSVVYFLRVVLPVWGMANKLLNVVRNSCSNWQFSVIGRLGKWWLVILLHNYLQLPVLLKGAPAAPASQWLLRPAGVSRRPHNAGQPEQFSHILTIKCTIYQNTTASIHLQRFYLLTHRLKTMWYRRQAIPWSKPNLVWLITLATPTQMPVLVKVGWVGNSPQIGEI